jgi:hypothetical protein
VRLVTANQADVSDIRPLKFAVGCVQGLQSFQDTPDTSWAAFQGQAKLEGGKSTISGNPEYEEAGQRPELQRVGNAVRRIRIRRLTATESIARLGLGVLGR